MSKQLSCIILILKKSINKINLFLCTGISNADIYIHEIINEKI